MINAVLRNLINNAIKFTQKGGEIKVSARMMKNFVEVSVSDSGIGIAKEYIQNLFRIDKTFNRAGTANERGTGLGLILCKEFVEKNGGTIWVESEENKGTTFRFTLPLAIE